MIQNSLSYTDVSITTDSAGLAVLQTLKPQKTQCRKTCGEKFFVPWVSFFLFAALAKDTQGGVVELEKLFLILKSLSTQKGKTLLCQRLRQSQEWDRDLTTKQGQAL